MNDNDDDDIPTITFALPPSFLDVFMLLGLVLLIHHTNQAPQVDFRLPPLIDPSGSHPVPKGAAPATQRVELRSDGRLVLNGDEQSFDTLVHTVSESADQIELAIEVGEDGRGATEVFLRLQLALSRAGVLDRLRILTLPEKKEAAK